MKHAIVAVAVAVVVITIAALIIHLVSAVQSAHQESNRLALEVIRAQQETIRELARIQRGPNVAAGILTILLLGSGIAAVWIVYIHQREQQKRLESAWKARWLVEQGNTGLMVMNDTERKVSDEREITHYWYDNNLVDSDHTALQDE